MCMPLDNRRVPAVSWRIPGAEAKLELKDPSLLLLHEDVGDCYEAVRRSAASAVGAEACDLALYEAETRSLIARRPRYAAPSQPVPRFRFPLDAAPASAH